METLRGWNDKTMEEKVALSVDSCEEMMKMLRGKRDKAVRDEDWQRVYALDEYTKGMDQALAFFRILVQADA